MIILWLHGWELARGLLIQTYSRVLPDIKLGFHEHTCMCIYMDENMHRKIGNEMETIDIKISTSGFSICKMVLMSKLQLRFVWTES